MVKQSFATGVILPFVLDMTFYFVQLFPKHATGFEVQHTFISSADELKVKEICQPKITVVTTLNYTVMALFHEHLLCSTRLYSVSVVFHNS